MSEAWQRLKQLFHAALDLPKEQRDAFAVRECGDDLELLAKLRNLLEADVEPVVPVEPSDLDSATPATPGLVGKVLGDFELLAVLGQGGMGEVYRARQRSLGRPVAVKVMRRGFFDRAADVARFHEEARRVAQLAYRGIVQVFAEGQDGDLHWFAMEFVDGHDLARELELQVKGEAGCILPRSDSDEFVLAVVRLCRDVALALDFAHRRGVVHRDIKPQNLLLRRATGEVLVGDFGIAKDVSFGSMVATESPRGTAYYMSPEQVGLAREGIDHRTDVFSLGVVLYELLTRRRPFEGQTSKQVWDAIVGHEPLPVNRLNPRVSRDLESVCELALEKDRRRRYESAAHLATDLGEILALRVPIYAKPLRTWGKLRRRARRHRRALVSTALVACGIVTGLWWRADSVHAAEVSRDRAEAQELLDVGDWATVSRDRLVELQRRVPALQAAKEGELARRVVTRLDSFIDLQRRRGEDLLRSGLAVVATAPHDLRFEPLLRGMMLIQDTLALAPDDPKLRRLVDPQVLWPRLAVEVRDEAGRELRGQVSYRALDQVSGLPGERVVLGPLPLRGASVPPGYLRVIVEPEGYAFREYTRAVYPGREESLTVAVRDGNPMAGMQLVPASSLLVPSRPLCRCSNQDKSIEVAAFWIDECEVSVAEYGRFLAATKRAAPFGWERYGNDPRYQDLPVVYVAWDDARAYAEWVGKRLVSHPEWELAARGPNGRLWPWTEDASSDYRGNTIQPYEPAFGTSVDVDVYLLRAAPVRSHPEACTIGPVRLHHMLGNVAEWSESVFAERQRDGSWRAEGYRRYVLGSAWWAKAREHTLDVHEQWGDGPAYANHYRGFRCARSKEP